MDEALERTYIPSSNSSDPSYTLLVPHRGRISRVKVNPTKESTFDAHFKAFEKLPPVAAKKTDEKAAVRQEGGAAAASAKRVGVNKEFFRQLRALFKIMIPRSNAKEVFVFVLHTSFLILRTYLR